MSAGTGDFKQLLYAARDGDLAGVKYWVARGADLNFLHAEFLFTPLHISIRNGHLDVARYLLEHGANPHLAEGYSADTPLSIAQGKNDAEAVVLLEEFGVQVKIGFWYRAKQRLWQRLMAFV